MPGRLNIASALQTFGRKAESKLPELRAALNTDDEQLKSAIEKTIEAIARASDTTIAERDHRAGLKEIADFITARVKVKGAPSATAPTTVSAKPGSRS